VDRPLPEAPSAACRAESRLSAALRLTFVEPRLPPALEQKEDAKEHKALKATIGTPAQPSLGVTNRLSCRVSTSFKPGTISRRAREAGHIDP
jgi:hypothetical protein